MSGFVVWDFVHLTSLLSVSVINLLSLAIVIFGIRNTECARLKCEFSVRRNNEHITWGLLIFITSLPLLAIYSMELFHLLDEKYDMILLHVDNVFELGLFMALIWSLYHSLCKELSWCALFAYKGKDNNKNV